MAIRVKPILIHLPKGMSELPESQKMTDVQQVHQTPTPPSKPFQRSGDNKGNHGRGKHQQPKFPKLMGDIDQMGGGRLLYLGQKPRMIPLSQRCSRILRENSDATSERGRTISGKFVMVKLSRLQQSLKVDWERAKMSSTG